MTDQNRLYPGNSDEFIWLRLFMGSLDTPQWYELAEFLNSYPGRLHFHVITVEDANTDDMGVAQRFARPYDEATIEAFAQFIRHHGGKAWIEPQCMKGEPSVPCIARIMMLCGNRNEYIRIRKELYVRFPAIQPRSYQVVGLICDERGNTLGTVSK